MNRGLFAMTISDINPSSTKAMQAFNAFQTAPITSKAINKTVPLKTVRKPWMPFSAEMVSPPLSPVRPLKANSGFKTVHQNLTEKALQELENSYSRLVNSINLNLFHPLKLNHYIHLAEKRSGKDYTDLEKEHMKLIVQSDNERALRLLALELGVGVPKKAERDAMSAMGALMLHRNNTQALETFLQKPGTDENIRSHVQLILMMSKFEKTVNRFDHWHRSIQKKFQLPKPFHRILS